MTAPSNPDLASLVKAILVRVPGISPDMVMAELGSAMLEFLSKSLVWRVGVDLTLPGGQNTVELASPGTPGAVPIWVLRVFHNGQLLRMGDLPYGSVQLDSDATTGPPSRARAIAPRSLRVWPVADQDYTLYVEMALTAADISVTVPAGFWITYREALIDGTLARLHSIPSTPASSERLAVFYQKKFSAASTSARVAVDRGRYQGVAPVAAYPRPPAARRF